MPATKQPDDGINGPLSDFGLDAPDESWMDRLREAESPAPLGSIGSFELLEEISRGGQGVVYRGRQRGTERSIALKRLLAGSLASIPARRRLEREVEAAAALDHPGIVSVFGVEIADGQPLLAMEWIDGVPLNRWARGEDGRRRTADEIIDMFLTVCDAVQHAHQRGVIHRDLKPSNVLVDAGGKPHVLDFGLAKFDDAAKNDDDEPALTLSREFLGTLPYAAPEQLRCRADEIDVRSDVYALGVMLYEMLTGRLPHDGTHRGSAEQALSARESHQPPRPSTLDRSLSRELDTILYKALALEPERRYQSVDSLAADLRRWQRGEPVLAHGPGLWYLLGKAFKRHRIAVIFLSTVLLLLGVGGIVAAALSVHLAASRQQEHEARQSAEQIGAFLQDMLASIDPDEAGGSSISARAMLDAAAERLEAELHAPATVRAALHATIGRSYAGLGLYDPAEQHLRQSLQLHEQAHGREHADIAAVLAELARVKGEQGDFQSARAALEESLAIRRRLFGDQHPLVLRSLLSLASMLHAGGRRAETEALVVEADALCRALLDQGQSLAGFDLSGLIGALAARGDMDAAESLLRQVLATHRRLHGPRSRVVASDLADLSSFLVRRRQYVEAEALALESLAISRAVLGDTHPTVADGLVNLALVYTAQDRDREALPFFEEALRIRRAVFGPQHPRIAQSLHDVALTYNDLNEPQKAVPLFLESIELYTALHGPNHRDVAISHWRLARPLMMLSQWPQAEQHLRTADGIWSRFLPADHWQLAYARNDLGACLMMQGHLDVARPLLEQTRPIIAARTGPDLAARRLAMADQRLAELQQRQAQSGTPSD